ncbi:MAG TPA: hypothetical protein GX736_02610 [Mogibacterium sp.]|nr:hypothetical protein [Mogibacterium sp.]
MMYRLSRATIVAIIFFMATASSTVYAFRENPEGEDARSPSMSIESGEEPIEDESVTLDIIDSENFEDEDAETVNESDEPIKSIEDSDSLQESETEEGSFFGLKKEVAILLFMCLGIMALFVLTLTGIRRRKKRRKTKNK